jgi:hypothetical protein
MIVDFGIALIALGIVVAMASVCALAIGLLAIGLEAFITGACKTWRSGPQGRKADRPPRLMARNPRSGD